MATTTPNYNIDYEDERFTRVEEEKTAALDNINNTYDNAINSTDKFYQDQINESKNWADTQTQIQNEQTDLAIEQIGIQKDQAKSDYIKEQSGAYVDWQKQSAQHGVNAEQRASAGLTGSGYSESSQVSMYNTYQNRVATARESYNRAVINYDMAIKDAKLQNNAAIAQIAHDALQQQLELALQGFQYKNNLLIEQANKKLEVDNIYYQRWQDVLDQMNTENQFEESIRQFNTEQERLKYEFEQGHKNQLELLQKNYENDVKLENLRYENEIKTIEKEDKLARERAKEEHERQLEILAQEHANAKALIEKQYEEQKKYAQWENSQSGSSYSGGGSSSGGSSGSSGGTYSGTSSTTSYEVSTDYYRGNKNSDCAKYGTFSNGYQPKGISGHGKLSKSGSTITVSTVTLSGEKRTVKQNVWKAEDGTLWYWEGRQNKYIQINQKGKDGGSGAVAGGASSALVRKAK